MYKSVYHVKVASGMWMMEVMGPLVRKAMPDSLLSFG